jgi:hypothetical protein
VSIIVMWSAITKYTLHNNLYFEEYPLLVNEPKQKKHRVKGK